MRSERLGAQHVCAGNPTIRDSCALNAWPLLSTQLYLYRAALPACIKLLHLPRPHLSRLRHRYPQCSCEFSCLGYLVRPTQR